MWAGNADSNITWLREQMLFKRIEGYWTFLASQRKCLRVVLGYGHNKWLFLFSCGVCVWGYTLLSLPLTGKMFGFSRRARKPIINPFLLWVTVFTDFCILVSLEKNTFSSKASCIPCRETRDQRAIEIKIHSGCSRICLNSLGDGQRCTNPEIHCSG